MSHESNNPSDPLDLQADFLDGSLDEAGLEQFRQLLVSDASAINSLVDAAIVQDLLISRYDDERSETSAVALLTSLGLSHDVDLAEIESTSSARVASACSVARRETPRRKQYAFAALAASALLAAGTFYWTTPAEIATITRTFDTSSDDSALQVGVRLVAGQRIQTGRGLVEITFDSGAVMAIKAPADVEFISDMLARSRAGRITVDVGQRAHGFTVETPTANIVDLGTAFGVGVQGDETDVVVFDGMVDLSAKGIPDKSRMHQGDALRVGSDGGLRRIISMNSLEFPTPNASIIPPQQSVPVISAVSDNIRDNQTTKCYRIVHGGLRDDAVAYVDRSHEWNGLDKSGLPRFLLGADYVMTFNDDKRVFDLQISITFARDAELYVFYDSRRPPPKWLTDAFQFTGVEIGLDEGPSRVLPDWTTGTGAGVSVDNRFGVWKCVVRGGNEFVLGPQRGKGVTKGDAYAMYGIAAAALED